jgi:hypothetical protein
MLRQRWRELPRLIRFMIHHFVIGVVLGWTSGLMVIWYDVGGIGSLLASHDSAALTALFFAKGGLYFGTFAMSVAVMNMGKEESGGEGPRWRLFPKNLIEAFGNTNADRPLKAWQQTGSSDRVFHAGSSEGNPTSRKF